jgi:plastocyanin
VVKQGQSLKFTNLDSTSEESPLYHTITACREPCNKTTGIAYPLADGRSDFDSGELGFGPRFAPRRPTATRGRPPKNLKPGTYTYFCRVHPFMRGAFRVKGKKTSRSAR